MTKGCSNRSPFTEALVPPEARIQWIISFLNTYWERNAWLYIDFRLWLPQTVRANVSYYKLSVTFLANQYNIWKMQLINVVIKKEKSVTLKIEMKEGWISNGVSELEHQLVLQISLSLCTSKLTVLPSLLQEK